MTRPSTGTVSGGLLLPSSATLDAGPGGLRRLTIDAPGGTAEVFLHGAHLASWTPAGHRPVLWMSGSSRYSSNAPIRGGVPVCFPWFGFHTGRPEAPQHGFARLSPWELSDVGETGDAVRATLRLTDSDESRSSPWPHRFEATYTVSIGAELQLTLEVVNRDRTAFSFEEALHTYFAVGDVCASRITGLEELPYYDADGSSPQQQATPLQIESGISQRYPTGAAAAIADHSNHRLIRINRPAGHGTIVWNPGPETARGMEDFDDAGWTNMVCVETCNIKAGAIRLEPGQRSLLRTTVTVEHQR